MQSKIIAPAALALTGCDDPRPRDANVEREALVECLNASGNSGTSDAITQCRGFAADVARQAHNFRETPQPLEQPDAK